MSTRIATLDLPATASGAIPLRLVVPVGRILYAAIFIGASIAHFSQPMIGYARQQGVPMPEIAVPFAGVMALAGGLSIALGFKARIGALLLILFLVPVTFMMHQFWAIADPAAAANQQAHFMKNLAMLGGALLIAYFGAGPISVDAARSGRRARSDA